MNKAMMYLAEISEISSFYDSEDIPVLNVHVRYSSPMWQQKEWLLFSSLSTRECLIYMLKSQNFAGGGPPTTVLVITLFNPYEFAGMIICAFKI